MDFRVGSLAWQFCGEVFGDTCMPGVQACPTCSKMVWVASLKSQMAPTDSVARRFSRYCKYVTASNTSRYSMRVRIVRKSFTSCSQAFQAHVGHCSVSATPIWDLVRQALGSLDHVHYQARI